MILEFHGQFELFTKVMKKREEQEINQLDAKRNEVMDDYGMGDLGRGESADE